MESLGALRCRDEAPGAEHRSRIWGAGGGADPTRHDGDDAVLGLNPPSPAPFSDLGSAAVPVDPGFPATLRQGERCVRASATTRGPAGSGDTAGTCQHPPGTLPAPSRYPGGLLSPAAPPSSFFRAFLNALSVLAGNSPRPLPKSNRPRPVQEAETF